MNKRKVSITRHTYIELYITSPPPPTEARLFPSSRSPPVRSRPNGKTDTAENKTQIYSKHYDKGIRLIMKWGVRRCINTLRIHGETGKGKRLKWSAAIGCFAPMAAAGGAIGCACACVAMWPAVATVARYAASELYQFHRCGRWSVSGSEGM